MTRRLQTLLLPVFIVFSIMMSSCEDASAPIFLSTGLSRQTTFSRFPIIRIETENNKPIVSRDDYLKATITVEGTDYNLSSTEVKIKGRGHSSWEGVPKKPYQIKFKNKTDFLNMPEDKKWVFLAEYHDKSLLRNSLSLAFGKMDGSGLEYTPSSKYAEVFVNNEYRGIYNIAQKAEVTDNRIPIDEESGYLLESDRLYYIDGPYIESKFKKVNDQKQYFAIKSPDEEDLTDEKKNKIQEFIDKVEKSILGEDTENRLEYIDVDSFVDWYLIQEISSNMDAFASSSYLYVDEDDSGELSTLYMGPIWDFDRAYANINPGESDPYEGWWIRKYARWFKELFKDETFAAKVRARFNDYYTNYKQIFNSLELNALVFYARKNNTVWDIFRTNDVSRAYIAEVNFVYSWLKKRMEWLNSNF